MASARSYMVLAFAQLLFGCDRMYEIDGKIVVVKGAGSAVAPAVVCVGNGGPLNRSGIYGHPAYRTVDSSTATVFCVPASDDVEFSFHETTIQGQLPRLAHVYAWLEPVPAAKKLCMEQGQELLQIDRATLDQLMSPEDAKKAPGDRAPVSYPCGRNPQPSVPMAYAVTFDPVGLIHSRGRFTRGGYDGNDGWQRGPREACAATVHG